MTASTRLRLERPIYNQHITMERSTTPTSTLLAAQQELSPLEQEVLDEYERLAENMKKVHIPHPSLSTSSPTLRPISIRR